MKEKSSLELFAIALYEKGYLQGNGDEINDLLERHKAMHKKEILESYRWGRYDSDKLVMSERFYREQYYEQTFGGNNGNNNSN